MKFRKTKMLSRLADEGRSAELDKESLDLMDSIDGLTAEPNRWRQTVYGEENAGYVNFEGQQIPVNLLDCE
jgi:hypothetical protein